MEKNELDDYEETSTASSSSIEPSRSESIVMSFCVKALEIVGARLAAAVRANILPLLAIVGGFWLWSAHAKPDVNELIELGLYGVLVVIPVLWRSK